jgi:hypothetical protein
MPWRYGVIRFRSKKTPSHRFYGVGELYYDSDPLKPFACSSEPDCAYFEDGDPESNLPEDLQAQIEIAESLKRMILDCERYPVFDSDGPFASAPWKGRLSHLSDGAVLKMNDEEIENKLLKGDK